MKKVTLIIGIILAVGCGLIKNQSIKHAPKTDFNVSQDVILYKGKPFAKLQAVT